MMHDMEVLMCAVYVAVSPFISWYLPSSLQFFGYGPWEEIYIGNSLVWGSLRLAPIIVDDSQNWISSIDIYK